MFEKKPLMVENTSVKTWKTPHFHPEPSPSFLFAKKMKGLAALPFLGGCLACKKEKGEKTEASTVSCF